MTDYTLRERSTTTRHVSVFIPYPDEEAEGGGWSYTATADADNVHIEFAGHVRLKHLPTLIELLELAAKADTTRNEEFGSQTFDFATYEKNEEEEYQNDLEERKLPVIGIVPEDFWIANGASVDKAQRSISTITLMRASNRYVVLEIGYPNLSFNAHELEALTALLKEFMPKEEEVS